MVQTEKKHICTHTTFASLFFLFISSEMNRLLTLNSVRSSLARHTKVKCCFESELYNDCDWAFHLQFAHPIEREVTHYKAHAQTIFLDRGSLKNTPFSVYFTSNGEWYYDTLLLSETEMVLRTSARELFSWDRDFVTITAFVQLLKKHEPNSHLLSYFEENGPFSSKPVAVRRGLSEEQRVELSLFWCEIIGKEIAERGLTLNATYKSNCDIFQAHYFLTRDGYELKE